MSSWDSGYGDFALVPDLDTLRLVPWLEATALVMCDLRWADGTDVAALLTAFALCGLSAVTALQLFI